MISDGTYWHGSGGLPGNLVKAARETAGYLPALGEMVLEIPLMLIEILSSLILRITTMTRVAWRARGTRASHAHAGWLPAGRWQVLLALARVMPREAGRRWLEEAESFLFEVADERRQAAVHSYLLAAPQTITVMWASETYRRARLAMGVDAPGTSEANPDVRD
jgi:hypothetical protein